MSEVRTCYKCQVERPLKMHCRSCQQTINTARRKPRQDHADAVKLAAGCADCAVTFGRVRR